MFRRETNLEDLERYLIGRNDIEGVPVCRSLDQQLTTPIPHLMTYPNGNVLLITGPRTARQWDPLQPLRIQL